MHGESGHDVAPLVSLKPSRVYQVQQDALAYLRGLTGLRRAI